MVYDLLDEETPSRGYFKLLFRVGYAVKGALLVPRHLDDGVLVMSLLSLLQLVKK